MKTAFVQSACLVLILTLLGAPATEADNAYTWTDADGIVHYSDKPPESGKAKAIKLKTSRLRDQPEAAPTAATQTNQDKQPADEEPVTVPTEEPSTLTLAQRRDNCERARKNLAALETRPQVLIDDKETGERRVLAYEEHADMIVKSREHVRKYCND